MGGILRSGGRLRSAFRHRQLGTRHMPMASPQQAQRRTPVILLDVMDTLVRDPFFTRMAPFFNMEFSELLQQKHPTAWVEFEKGLISEEALYANFFKDGRCIDGQGLRETMVSSYDWVEGMETLVGKLKTKGYELHAMSNYPMWHRYIEGKLQLSRYLEWTFLSCEGPMKGLRKPAPEAYLCAAATLQLPPSDIIFVDDREVNVQAAEAIGMRGVLFSGASSLEQALVDAGINL